MNKNGNAILQKSKKFALDIIGLYKFLTTDKKEFVLSKQILRSGTSIGANVNEAQEAQSAADFISKLSIALKEARETVYWLELLHESGYIFEAQFQDNISELDEIISLLISIIKTKKSNSKI